VGPSSLARGQRCVDSSVLLPPCLVREHFSGTCYFKSAFPTTSTPPPAAGGDIPSSSFLRHPLLHPASLSGSCDPLPIKVMHKCEHLRQGWIFLHFVLLQKSTVTPHPLNGSAPDK